ncbi:hypothetical protein BTVI_14389 [Pitangus sulphuratus]|nr:hypothetical protein BTVI_14389 [Pitangus sulphuratus]
MISGIGSSWRPVTSDVPQGSILGKVLSNSFLNDLDEVVDTSSASSLTTRSWGGVVNNPEGCAALQRDLNRLERWAENCLKFNKGQCRVLLLGKNNPRHQYRLEADLLESSSAEEDLGILVDNKLPMSQQCVLVAKKASGVLRCIRKSTASRLRKYKRDVELLEQVHQQVTKLVTNGMEHLSYKERLRELGLFSLKKK